MTVASEITRLQGAKSCICSAIVNKGVSVSSSLKLDSYYSCINAIPNAVYLTQQEYDALPSSKLTDGVPYGIMVSGNVSKFIRNGTEYNLTPMFNYIVVGGGAAGGIGGAGGGSAGGGGGGEVLFGTSKTSLGTSLSVTIGQGGQKAGQCCTGGTTCFGTLVAKGGCFPISRCSAYRSGGDSGSGCLGWQHTDSYSAGSGGGGGGAGGDGCAPVSGNLGGNGGAGICGYGGGGGGASYNSGQVGGTGVDGGGNGNGGNATNYGGGGGGGNRNAWGGTGCQGVVIVCYKENGGSGINCATGGTVTTCNGYTIHTFTTDGTFTIVS